jgi:hypothetical protein
MLPMHVVEHSLYWYDELDFQISHNAMQGVKLNEKDAD